MDGKALGQIKIVEYGNMVSAPYCAKLMADLGAEVIKVEQPDRPDESRKHGPFLNDIPHPERSGLFLYLNSNKLGITLNIATPTGREIMERLLQNADIFVENNPPQHMKELGLDYSSVRKENPRLIMTSITPFGQTGPYKDYAGYDINSQAAGGITHLVGSPDREPLVLPLSQSGYQGGLCGAIGSLLAFMGRQATGRGQHVDVAEAEVWSSLDLGWFVLAYLHKQRDAHRSGHRMEGYEYPYAIMPCKDGYVLVLAAEEHQWKSFLELLGNPEWTRDPRFKDRGDIGKSYANEVDALISPWLMEHTKDEIFALAKEKKLPFAPVKSFDEVVNEPQLEARKFWATINRAETGALKYPGMCYKLSETPGKIEWPAPLLGEHNELIYCNRLGYSREELARLRQCGVI